MQFNSVEYIVFFVVVLGLYYFWARKFSTQKVLIVLASAMFYALWSPRFLVHFVGMVSFNYWASLKMHEAVSKGAKRGILICAILIDVCNLFVFKYLKLAITEWNWLITRGDLGDGAMVIPEIVLPLAISFYTFHVISYLVDQYRDLPDSKPKGYLEFLFYVMLFPHQIAGPILRGHELFPQLSYKSIDRENICVGFNRMLLGLFQKAVVADNLAIIVDHGYKAQQTLTSGEVYVVLIAYAFQILFDFSGYTNMGIGAARMLGYRLPENFDVPYIAADISEFWRRWHMTLSRWVRDYIFIPLGGSRGSEIKTALNLMVTMGIAGLWHGASGMFVLWGLYHGVGLVVHRWYARAKRIQMGVARIPNFIYRPLAIVVTFHFVLVGWVFFRSPDFSSSVYMLSQLGRLLIDASSWRIHEAFVFKSYGFTAMALYGLFCIVMANARLVSYLEHRMSVRMLGYSLAIYLILLLSPQATDPFIYFQF